MISLPKQDLVNLTSNHNDTIDRIIHKMNKSGKKIIFIIKNKKLVGSISDGDIRRAILKFNIKNTKVTKIMNRFPVYINNKELSKHKIKLIMKKNNAIPVIMISGHATVTVALESIRLGAYEFIEKGASFSIDKLLNYVNRALEAASLKEEKEIIESKLFHSFELIGKSPSILKVKKVIEKLSNTESRVLISGPTGSGKELVARKIHKLSSRNKKPFVVINAASLNEKTYEKELFGQEFEDGTISFGAFDRANKGTLLIDEVTETPIETQAIILRVLIDQKFKRINGKKDVNVNVRIISSTSRNLLEEVATGKFREDLFHRLNVVPIELSSLTSRTEDIPELINYFKKKISEINRVQEIEINTKNDQLYTYNWPGNGRELRNLIERITIVSANESKESINKSISDILNNKRPIDNNSVFHNTFTSI